MKRVVLMIIPALICGGLFTGCSNDEATKDVKTASELYVIGSKSVGLKSSSVKAGDKTDLVFTGDDIVSFNARYGEIVFTESKFEEIISRLSLHTELLFFIGDNPVFDPPIQLHYGWGLSNGDCDLQFRTDGVKTCLTDRYMHVDSLLSQVEREVLEKAMEANKEKRKRELEVLINYLTDAGKITERVSPIPEDEYSLPDCNKHVIFDDTLYVKTPFIPSLEISEMKIEGNYLKVRFSATGCNGNSWVVNLLDWEEAVKSNPGKRFLKLTIDNKGDCDTWRIAKEDCFNIEKLQIEGMNRLELNVSGNVIFYEY
jgi:hypothetical protein